MTTRLNVRCCCTPLKIYGTLPAPDNVHVGSSVTFRSGQDILTFNVEKMAYLVKYSDAMLEQIRPELLSELIQSNTELAFKYEGDDISAEHKLATLRLVPGFQEAP